MDFLSIFDIIIPIVILVFLLVYANGVKNKNVVIKPEYQYFTKALLVKIFGALAFACIYLFYYKGGDSINYYNSAIAIENLLFYDFQSFYKFYFHQYNETAYNDMFFYPATGYPIYKLSDDAAIFTSKFYMPVIFLSGNSYVGGTVLSAFISFFGLWKLYQVFVNEFPQLKRQLFISIFLIPSVFFWGSGIMKDSLIIAAIGWYVYSFYWFFIKKKRSLLMLVYLFISAYLIISVKPYVLFALLPGSIIWLSNQMSSKFRSKALKRIFTPLLLVIGGGIAFIVLNQVDEMLGQYKLDSVFDRASIVHKDMKMDYYGGKSFNIGDYEPTLGGMMGVAHKAIFASLFRPTLFDTQNVVMIFSAIENTYILLLTLFLLIKLRFIGFFRFIGSHPLLLFSILFSLFFAFSVGISISNFGSLVRLRIPALPFFVSSLFIIKYMLEKESVAKQSI
jgi:hypothetical protein